MLDILELANFLKSFTDKDLSNFEDISYYQEGDEIENNEPVVKI